MVVVFDHYQPVSEGARVGKEGAAVDARPLAAAHGRVLLSAHEGDPDGNRHVRRNWGKLISCWSF